MSMSMLYAVGVLLLGAAWLQPLHVLPWMSWHSEVLAFLGILLVTAAELLRKSPNNVATRTVRLPASLVILFALTGILMIQFSNGFIGFLGDFVVVFIFLAVGIFAAGAGFAVTSRHDKDLPQQARTLSHVSVFALAVLAAAACSVALALVQALGVWDGVEWINRLAGYRRPGANMGQPNHLVTLLVMGLASLALLFESGKLGALAASTLLGVLVLGVAITESRSGVLSMLALLSWWVARRRVAGLKASTSAIAAGCIWLIASLWAWPTFLEYVQAGGLTTGAPYASVNTAAGTRLVVWPQMVAAALQKPWLGWGLREVSAAHNAVLDAYPSSEPFTYAHNIFLDLAIGVGVPLALLFTGLTSIWIVRRIRAARTLLPWYCVAVLIPVGVHSLFEYPFAYAYFAFPALFAVGMLEGVLKPNASISINKFSAVAVLGILSMVMAWTVWEYIQLEEDFRVTRFEVLRIGRTPADYERPSIYLLTQLAAMTEVSRMVPAPGMDAVKIDLARRAALRFPWFAIQNRYALSLALNGNPDEAIRQLKVMRAMHGEKSFEGIRANWKDLANTKYPQLGQLQLP
jgi:hypothetical protein